MSIAKTICIIHHTGDMGGGTKSFIDVMKMLKNDFNVIACIPSGADKLKGILDTEGIEVKEINSRIPLLPRYSGGSSLFSTSMFRSLLGLRKKNIKSFCAEIEVLKPDVLIFNSIVTVVSAPFFSSKIKKICFVRETIVNTLSGNYFRKIIENHISGVCFLAEAEKDKMKLTHSSAIVIPDSMPSTNTVCIDRDTARNSEGLPVNEYIILYMGGMLPIKGAETALDAVSRLGAGYRLIIGGTFDEDLLSLHSIVNHWYSVKYITYMLKLRISYFRVKRRGLVTTTGYRQDISGIISACDVVVFPSTSVHQPRPCIEAGYYDKPVIISDYTETKEFFKDGYNALTFKPKSSKELAKKLKYAKENPSVMMKLGVNNHKMSDELHNYDAIQADLHTFLYKLI